MKDGLVKMVALKICLSENVSNLEVRRESVVFYLTLKKMLIKSSSFEVVQLKRFHNVLSIHSV